MLKNFILKFLNITLGRAVRLTQSFMSDSRVFNTNNHVLKVTEELHNYAVTESVQYAINNMRDAIVFRSRNELWDFVLGKIQSPQPTFFEFGVHEGYSINYLSSRLNFSRVYGFDSFRGLEEDWSGYSLPKGTFDLKGKIPAVVGGVTLIAGWFEDTLPNFLEEHQDISKIDLLHMDADTYTPTRFVLRSLQNKLLPGAIIIFDEYFGYNNWMQHEYKAFQEYVSENNIKYSYIALSDMQVAIQLN